jgi:hypothetical protein
MITYRFTFPNTVGGHYQVASLAGLLGGLLSSAVVGESLQVECSWDEKGTLSSEEKSLLKKGERVQRWDPKISLVSQNPEPKIHISSSQIKIVSKRDPCGGAFHLDPLGLRLPEQWDLETTRYLEARNTGKSMNFGTPYGAGSPFREIYGMDRATFTAEYQGTFSEGIVSDDPVVVARFANPTGSSPERVQMPMFELQSYPRISLEEIRERRFNPRELPKVPETLKEMIERGLKEYRYIIRRDRFSMILQRLAREPSEPTLQ